MTDVISHYAMGTTLAERWRKARESADPDGISMNELDRRIGQSSGYTTRVESGEKTDPALNIVIRAAEALNIRPAWLAFGDGPMREIANADRLRAMNAGAFLGKVLGLPKLQTSILKRGERWTVWDLVGLVDDMLEGATLQTTDGSPVRGTWDDLLDAKAGRESPTVVGDAERVRQIHRKQHPPRRER